MDAAKFTFSYAFQLAPLVKPTRDVWALDLDSWFLPGLGRLPNVLVLGRVKLRVLCIAP